MKLKKLNAIFGMLTALCLLVHAGITTYYYAIQTEPPRLARIPGRAAAFFLIFHACYGLYKLFFVNKRLSVPYPRINLRVILQRVSAFTLLILLWPHIMTFSLSVSLAGTGWIWALCAVEILFNLALWLHITLSLSPSLLTLGLISSMEARRRVDIATGVILGLALGYSTFVIISTQLRLFR